jgi:integrase
VTGTITKHKQRDGRISWGYVFDLAKDRDGQRRQVTKKGFRTKGEAADELRRAIANRDQIARTLDPRTFGEFFDTWIHEHCERNLEVTTVEGYIKKGAYAKQHFGSVALVKLTPLEIESALNTLRDQGGRNGGPLSAKTVREVAAVVNATLNAAIRWGALDFNPMRRVTVPRMEKKEARILEKDQIEWLFAAAQDHPWLYVLVVLDASTGCRRGELLALTWDDVDLENRSLTISKASPKPAPVASSSSTRRAGKRGASRSRRQA